MAINISDIIQQKFAEIQSRVPIKLNGFASETSFAEALNSSTKALESTTDSISDLTSTLNTLSGSSSASTTSASGISGLSTSGVTSASGSHAADIARARLSLSAGKTSIPTDKAAQMSVINKAVDDAAAKYHLDRELLMAVIKQESNYNPYSISSAGAQGLMQLMPGTADSLGVENPFDISQNVDGGAKYLKDQLVTFGGDLQLALAAYNAGPYSVKKYDGIPPYTETQNYVARVMKYYKQYSGQD
ncbi:MAG: lytic transglycosylase domain-containing protein [Clostridiales bacterium]|nr:lytic transglycosylase domain-containing protein [Clostridiales bacterium]